MTHPHSLSHSLTHSLTHAHAFLAWPLDSRALSLPWGGGGANDEVNDLITRYDAVNSIQWQIAVDTSSYILCDTTHFVPSATQLMTYLHNYIRLLLQPPF